MNVADFRRFALSLEGAEEGSHMGAPDFRVGGRIFATLASQGQGYGNLMLTPEQQTEFVRELPRRFPAHSGRLGKNGSDPHSSGESERGHVSGALRTAWKLRVEKNAKTNRKKRAPRRG